MQQTWKDALEFAVRLAGLIIVSLIIFSNETLKLLVSGRSS